LTIEQFENQGTTSILYRNCIGSQGFGAIADFLEFTLRPKTNQTSTGFPAFKGQDGAIVLIQCLDNIGDKGYVVGTLIHPDRPTTITSTDPQLSGEYNGINVQIASDGSFTFTFKGATDSSGSVIDSSQKPTTCQIQNDGSLNITTAAGSMCEMTNDGSIKLLSNNGNTVILDDGANEISINQKDGSIVDLTSSGVKITDPTGGELNINSGMVALGNSTAELLDLFNQLLQALSTLLTSLSTSAVTAGPFPVAPPLAVATAPAIVTITQIQTLLALIKGSL
jgi:hypothetical protein